MWQIQLWNNPFHSSRAPLFLSTLQKKGVRETAENRRSNQFKTLKSSHQDFKLLEQPAFHFLMSYWTFCVPFSHRSFMFTQNTKQFYSIGGREGGEVMATLTDELRKPQNPQQLVVDTAPTAHLGLTACCNMPVETCDSSDHDRFPARRRRIAKTSRPTLRWSNPGIKSN